MSHYFHFILTCIIRNWGDYFKPTLLFSLFSIELPPATSSRIPEQFWNFMEIDNAFYPVPSPLMHTPLCFLEMCRINVLFLSVKMVEWWYYYPMVTLSCAHFLSWFVFDIFYNILVNGFTCQNCRIFIILCFIILKCNTVNRINLTGSLD